MFIRNSGPFARVKARVLWLEATFGWHRGCVEQGRKEELPSYTVRRRRRMKYVRLTRADSWTKRTVTDSIM